MTIFCGRAPRIVSLIALGSITFFTGFVWAAGEDYPAKPVTLNVGYAPGGGASISAHIFTEGLQKYLAKPQPIIINHKPGASLMIAADYFMKQPADGYNLLWATQDHPMRMALEPQKFAFTIKDLSYIGTLGDCPFTLAVNDSSPFKTIEEFIDYAKKHPGEMTFSSTGIATANHLTGELLMKAAGVKLTHVPFMAGAPATLAMLGGHVTCTVMSPGALGAHIKPGGKARVLVVFDDKRFPELPDVPCSKEKGYAVSGHTYNVLIARKGTPKAVLETLTKLFKQTADDPVVQSNTLKAGYLPIYLSPEETTKRIKLDFEMAGEIFEKLTLVGK